MSEAIEKILEAAKNVISDRAEQRQCLENTGPGESPWSDEQDAAWERRHHHLRFLFMDNLEEIVPILERSMSEEPASEEPASEEPAKEEKKVAWAVAVTGMRQQEGEPINTATQLRISYDCPRPHAIGAAYEAFMEAYPDHNFKFHICAEVEL